MENAVMLTAEEKRSGAFTWRSPLVYPSAAVEGKVVFFALQGWGLLGGRGSMSMLSGALAHVAILDSGQGNLG